MPIFLYKVSERGIVATVQLPLNSPVRGDIKVSGIVNIHMFTVKLFTVKLVDRNTESIL